MSLKLSHRNDRLWPWYVATTLYLLLGGIVLYDRWNEVGPLLEAPPITTRLPLNSIGDILAGFFAPLAFLWLFVATLLQRKELRLQREELAETRSVLDQQKSELQRAAEESNNQTKIMQMNLDSSLSNEKYQLFNLSLYFFARSLYIRGNVVLDHMVRYPEDGGRWTEVSIGLLNFTPSIYLSSSDPSAVDLFFEKYREKIEQITMIYRDSENFGLVEYIDNSSALSLLKATVEGLEKIFADHEILGNSLINIRYSSMCLYQLFQTCNRIIDKIEEFNIERAKEGDNDVVSF